MNAKITALDELINAVEAGEFCISKFPRGMAEWFTSICHSYHGDLNAAKALHDALLPGWGYRVSPSYAIVMHPRLSGPAVEKDATSQENPARAWLLAILRAYRAQIGGVE